MNTSPRSLPPWAAKLRRYGKTATLILVPCLMLSLDACQSTRPLSDRMESKYSLKKRKSYISCTRPEGLSECPLPLRVKESSYHRMLAWIEASKGTKYRFGGTVPDGFDCSGFVQYLYSISFQMQLPRTSADLALLGAIVPRRELRRGDLVFFSNGGNEVDHVGIFLGDDRFAHSASKTGVIVSTLRQGWYDTHFCFGTRVVRVD